MECTSSASASSSNTCRGCRGFGSICRRVDLAVARRRPAVRRRSAAARQTVRRRARRRPRRRPSAGRASPARRRRPGPVGISDGEAAAEAAALACRLGSSRQSAPSPPRACVIGAPSRRARRSRGWRRGSSSRRANLGRSHDVMPVARRLGDLHAARDDGPQHLVAEVRADLAATWSASLVRPSYIVSRMVVTSQLGVEVRLDQLDVAAAAGRLPPARSTRTGSGSAPPAPRPAR